MLMEQLEYNLLFRWFVGLNMDDPVWDPTVFSKNRDRLLAADVAALVFLCAGRGQSAGLGLGRTLHRRWDVAGGLGESEEFQEGGTRRSVAARGRSWESDGGFSRRDPDQCHACVDDGSCPLSRNCTFRQIAIRVAAARRCCSRTSARTRTSSRCQRSCSTR
ncbi:MAG: hypothetical protein DMF94_05275 [Acidobacteria bacterium]|nr:MAG: hypothetical protein DMF94_05275 [Acidobacteriota bacterium]